MLFCGLFVDDNFKIADNNTLSIPNRSSNFRLLFENDDVIIKINKDFLFRNYKNTDFIYYIVMLGFEFLDIKVKDNDYENIYLFAKRNMHHIPNLSRNYILISTIQTINFKDEINRLSINYIQKEVS